MGLQALFQIFVRIKSLKVLEQNIVVTKEVIRSLRRRHGSENVAQTCKFEFVNRFRRYVSLFYFWKQAGLLGNWI